MENKKSNTLPILALIFGIASFVTSFTIVLGVICGLVSIVLSIICFAKRKPVAMPIVGIILAVIGIILSTFILIISIILLESNDGIISRVKKLQDESLIKNNYEEIIRNTIEKSEEMEENLNSLTDKYNLQLNSI